MCLNLILNTLSKFHIQKPQIKFLRFSIKHRLSAPILIVVGFISGACATHKITDVSQEPGYKEMLGREFQTNLDVVVFKENRSQKGLYLGLPGSPGIPSDLPKSFPYDDGGIYIVGVLPAGSTFKITKTIRSESFEMASIHFIAIVSSSGQFQSLEVDPTWLAEGAAYPNVPKFDPKYVQAVGGINSVPAPATN